MWVSARENPAAPSLRGTRLLNLGRRPGLTLILNPNGLYWAVLQSAAVRMSATCPAVGIANAALTSSGRASALWNVPLFPTVGEVSFVFIVILCLHRRLGGF